MDFDLIRATLLALIQGLTEFLPISSSAHLIIPSALLGWEDQGLAFDVAVHLGSLFAVMIYFRRELHTLFFAWWRSMTTRSMDDDSRLAWMLIVATLPAAAAGYIFKDLVEVSLRNVVVIAVATIGFGLLLGYADLRRKQERDMRQMDWKTCLFIGFAQVLAFIPGTSRSGITMTAALLCNIGRLEASRFSFLLSIPIIAGASLLLLVDLVEAPDVNWLELGYGVAVTALVAFFCIHYFLRLIGTIGFMPFVIYRLVLGGVLLYLA